VEWSGAKSICLLRELLQPADARCKVSFSSFGSDGAEHAMKEGAARPKIHQACSKIYTIIKNKLTNPSFFFAKSI
jgi:hypothetical protein